MSRIEREITLFLDDIASDDQRAVLLAAQFLGEKLDTLCDAVLVMANQSPDEFVEKEVC